MKRPVLATLVAIGPMLIASAASAAVTVDTTMTGPRSGATYNSFDNLALGSATQMTGTGITVSFSGAGAVVQGSSGGQYAAPTIANGSGASFGAANGVDTTRYLSSGIGSVTLTFTTPVNYVGLLWGSLDAYNTLTFNTADGVTTFNGGQFGASADTRYLNFVSTSLITSIVASSTTPSFEFDNVATGVVPEPAGWAMMIAGFGLMGAAMRRRRVTATFA